MFTQRDIENVTNEILAKVTEMVKVNTNCEPTRDEAKRFAAQLKLIQTSRGRSGNILPTTKGLDAVNFSGDRDALFAFTASIADAKLRKAQEKVAKLQEKLEKAKEVAQKLQNGEKMPTTPPALPTMNHGAQVLLG